MKERQGDPETWLAPFLAALGYKTRGRMCPAYVAGLIGRGDRMSAQPMAARDGSVGYDRLHRVITRRSGDRAPLEADPARMARARVRKIGQTALNKPELAITEIDRARAAGVRFGCVLADAGYGSSGPFRQALSAGGLLWAVGLSRRQNVYPADVGLVFPEAGRGRRRKHHLPDRMGICAERRLGKLTCQFAATRIRLADGHKHPIADGREQAMPGDEEVWLIGERRATGGAEIRRLQPAS